MAGIGIIEFAIIVVVALLMLGAPVITFFAGYLVGKKSGTIDVPAPDAPAVTTPSPEPPTADLPPRTAEEPRDD